MMILGRKLGMTHVFDEQGQMTPVTVIGCDKNVVVGHRTTDRHGYLAIQVATRGSKHLTKPIKVHLEKAKVKQPLGVIREFRATNEEIAKFTPGSEVELTTFGTGEPVTVTAISKGKGFAGTIKRHGFARGPKTHGSNSYRRPGSIGSQEPQRVVKGKPMPGHMGVDQVTIKGLKVMTIDPVRRLIVLQGSVPGPNRGLVMIKQPGLIVTGP